MVPQKIGKYPIIERIGTGAMGVVYKAMDLKLGRPVAIKTMPPQLVDNAEIRTRFHKEAIAPAKLFHPNIVAIYDLDEEDGLPFITMEYIDGVGLELCRAYSILLTIPQILNLLIQMSEGLDFAHKNGIVHRDVKPANFILARNETLKIVDFGIARVLESVQSTRTGLIIGTPAYMSPEQARAQKVDARSDQFSVGVIAYELIAGMHPFQADSYVGILSMILEHNPQPLTQVAPNCPEVLEAAIMKAMEKNRDNRHPDLRTFSTICQKVRERYPSEQCRLESIIQNLDRLRSEESTEEKTCILTVDPEIVELLGQVENLMEEHRYDDAAEVLNRVLTLDPDNIKAVTNLQRIRRLKKEKIFQEVIQPRLEQAARYQSEGHLDRAAETYRQVISLDPSYVEAKSLLEEVEQLLEKKVQTRKRSAEIQLLADRGDFALAFRHMGELEAAAPDPEGIAQCREALGNAFLNEFLNRCDAAKDRHGQKVLRDWINELFALEPVISFFLSPAQAKEKDRFIQETQRVVSLWLRDDRLDGVRILLDSLIPVFPRESDLKSLQADLNALVQTNQAGGTERIRLYFPSSSKPMPVERQAPGKEMDPKKTLMGARWSPKENLPKEERIAAYISVIVHRPDFPAISEHIQEVLKVLADEEKSLRMLTSIILKDYSLTLRVLRAANSIHYNRSGRPILSVSQAVILLGVDAIRSLATGCLLLEHFHRKSPGLKELMLLSLLTANHTRELAFHLCFPHPEEAYLCGMFRNLGEVLIACYFPREYAQILILMNEKKFSEHHACQEVLRFLYEELGQAMAQHWNVSEKVAACMGSFDPASSKVSRTEAGLLHTMVSFSHGLTSSIYRSSPENSKSAVNNLLEKFNRILPMKKDALREILDSAIVETKETFAGLKVPLGDLSLMRQSEVAVETLATLGPPTPPATPIGESLTTEALMKMLIEEIEALLHARDDFDLNGLIMMVLEAISRGCGTDRALFCLVNPDKTRVQARIGLGEGAEKIVESFTFPLSLRGGPLVSTLLGKRDKLVTDISKTFFAESEISNFGAGAFGLYPMIVEGAVVGCLYFDWLKPQHQPGEVMMAALSKLRAITVEAIIKKHTMSGK